MLKFANISGFNAREDYWGDKEIHWNERASLTGGSCGPHGRATRPAHLCERVKRERVVGRQLASRSERRAELVQ